MKHRVASIFFRAFCALLLILAVSPVVSATPPVAPMLRIDPGTHTAMISRIAANAAGTMIATASNDKTLRVWDAQSGLMVQTLRVPIDTGKDGMLYAAAMSPDGQTAATGGWTGYAWDRANCIYMFDLGSNPPEMSRITGLPQVVLHLAFSKDGRYLAATLASGAGLRVYRIADKTLVASDLDYGGHSYWADFDALGRLATACYDGNIRLYDAQFNLTAKSRARGGQQPYSVAFSPDGGRVAVGYSDSSGVDVLSASDLSPLFSPSKPGDVPGAFSGVAWSISGEYLFGAGQIQGRGGVIRRWFSQGTGRFIDMAAARDSVLQVLPLSGGRTVFCSAEPSWGIFNQAGRRIIYNEPAMADFRGQGPDAFSVSRNGNAVRFGLEYGGKRPMLFRIDDRTLRPAPAQIPGMTGPQWSAPGLSLANWKNSRSPTVNGRPIELEPYETSRCATATPDGSRFLLGTEWFLRCYDQNGGLLWKTPLGGAVWAAAISGDGRVAVAAAQDGAIRWLRMSDGKQVMSLFPHADGRRWILWTPSGHYAASAGADNLIGWHVNQGLDQPPDFFPAARFRAVYCQPNAPARALQTLDSESVSPNKSAPIVQILPPAAAILSPQDGASFTKIDLTLVYEIRNPSGAPLTNVRVLVDGRPPIKARGIRRTPKNGKTGRIQIPLPPRDCEISVIAENQMATGNPATIQLRWAGQPVPDPKPRLRLLAVGVSNYDQPDLQLGFPAKDAKDLAAVFERQRGRFYSDVYLRVVADKDAGRRQIIAGLDWIQNQTQQGDVAVIFMAGHGVNGPGGNYFFLPRDADPERLPETGVSYEAIRDVIIHLPGKAIAFVDTCHSGDVMGKHHIDVDQMANDLSATENGVVVFASSTGRQVSLEHPRWGNGAFTKALVEALSGQADYTNDQTITINELDLYIAERVAALTKGRQTPTTTKPMTVPNFPVASYPP